ncbi:MAG: hypothetical protein ACYDBJ_23995 [Aggregatilineales bacterium]
MQPLTVRVDDELTLNAGCVREVWETGRPAGTLELTPPVTPMYDQITSYLETKSSVGYGISSKVVGLGLTALAVRWGSYLATLLDATAPPHPELPTERRTRQREVWLMADEQMRLNREISANLARLGTLYRERRSAYYDLLTKACAYLPMPFRTGKANPALRRELFAAYTYGSFRVYLKRHPNAVADIPLFTDMDPDTIQLIEVGAGEHNRVLGNFLTANGIWHNTLLRDLTVPLQPAQRRFTAAAEQSLVRTVCANATAVEQLISTLFNPDPQFETQPDRLLLKLLARYPDSATAVRNVSPSPMLSLPAYPDTWSSTATPNAIRLPGAALDGCI